MMVPLVGNVKELRNQKEVIKNTAEAVFAERNDRIDYMIGTMIEIPRAAVTANEIAEEAEFFSFGTNDLTQMTLGFSRDDVAKFLPVYLEKGILKHDPFQGTRSGRRGSARARGRIQGPRRKARTQVRHLRRARRRTELGRVLPLCRTELRLLLSVPRAYRASCSGACGAETRRGEVRNDFMPDRRKGGPTGPPLFNS